MAALDPAPPRCPALIPAGGQRLLFPQRAQIKVVLQQLPLKLAAPGPDQFLQLIVGHLPGPAAGQILRQGLKADPRAGKGVSRRGHVVGFHWALLFLLVRIWFAPSNLRKKSPPLRRAGMTHLARRGGAA